jgi:excisionase family DNA binding protein
MLKQVNLPKTYTPEQVAEILQLSKNTIYELIARGEIVAKKIGRVYRIPRTSISFVFTGHDEDIYQMQKEDEKNLEKAKDVIRKVRKQLWQKSKSF